jgi:hypothetical protein
VPPQSTAAEVIKVDTPETGSTQDSLHIKKDGDIVFAIDGDGNVIVGDLGEGIEGSLPTPVGETDGYVLTVDTDEAVWAAPGTELPTPVGETDGYVLTVDTDAAVWAAPAAVPDEVPDPSGETDGALLSVESGEAIWAYPPMLPDPSGEDDLALLSVDSGEAIWAYPPMLPDPGLAAEGNILHLDDVLTPGWTDLATVMDLNGIIIVPDPQGEPDGSVLTVSADVPIWEAPSGGITVVSGLPEDPSDGDLVFDTQSAQVWWCDVGDDELWKGSSVLATFPNVQGISASQTVGRVPVENEYRGIFINFLSVAFYVATTNDGSNYWDLTLNGTDFAGAAQLITTISTSAFSPNTRYLQTDDPDEILLDDERWNFVLVATKVGSPGELSMSASVRYRQIATIVNT